MERLNALNIGYLKSIPQEDVASILYDAVINEINDNWDEEQEILAELPEMVRVFYLIVGFSNYVNFEGLKSYLESEHGYMYPMLIDALRKVRATDTADVVEEAIENVRLQMDMDYKTFVDVLRSQTLYELSDTKEVILEIQDGDMALKATEEPIYDYLIDYFLNTIEDLSNEEYI